jgi:hypothetical protein
VTDMAASFDIALRFFVESGTMVVPEDY